MGHHFLMVSFVSFLMEMMCLFSGATGTSKTPKGACIVELCRNNQEPLVGNCLLRLTGEKQVKWGHSLPSYLLLRKGRPDFCSDCFSFNLSWFLKL